MEGTLGRGRIALLRDANVALHTFVSDAAYPCVGARAALHAGSYVVAAYQELGTEQTARELHGDIRRFVENETLFRDEYATFLAAFDAPDACDETEFERLLWLQLQHLNAVDQPDFAWDTHASRNVTDPEFSFSIAGEAFYIVGMHRSSSRLGRRFPFTALAFNPHAQFERLRTDGKWRRMQHTIREREMALQGSINPMLSDFGSASEAKQYSGRAVPNDWTPPIGKCPFGR